MYTCQNANKFTFYHIYKVFGLEEPANSDNGICITCCQMIESKDVFVLSLMQVFTKVVYGYVMTIVLLLVCLCIVNLAEWKGY